MSSTIKRIIIISSFAAFWLMTMGGLFAYHHSEMKKAEAKIEQLNHKLETCAEYLKK